MGRYATRPDKEERKENIKKLKRRINIDRPSREELRRELSDYLKARRQKLEVVKSTETPSGQKIDWIDPHSQVPEGVLATPPPGGSRLAYSRGKKRDRPVRFELDDPKVECGPKGTVPIARRNLRALAPRPLTDHLSKHGRKTYPLIRDGEEIHVPGSGSSHLYANTKQSVTCYGGEGYLNIYDPYLQWSDEFSLQQIALARGSGNKKQTIEAGWQEYRDLYGDWVPHLFIYYTTNGYTESGDNKGGYNRDVDGWVQYSGSIYPEATFSKTSKRGGNQYVFKIKYQLYEGNWWLAVQNQWIGYYPASLFSTGGLRSKASKVAFYGEIVDSSDHSSATHTDMGSGYFPDYGWKYSSYLRSLKYQSSTGGAMSTYDADSSWPSDEDLYDLITHMKSGGTWGSYFWLGGPGAG
jgi:hypothetical protein